MASEAFLTSLVALVLEDVALVSRVGEVALRGRRVHRGGLARQEVQQFPQVEPEPEYGEQRIK